MTTENQRNNSDKRLKNLRPWKPGQSGNAKGRPKNSESMTTELRLLLERPANKHKTNMQLLVESTFNLALKGHNGALKEIWQRIDGSAPEESNTEEIDKIPWSLIKRIRENAGLD